MKNFKTLLATIIFTVALHVPVFADIDITVVMGDVYLQKTIPTGSTVENLVATMSGETGDLFVFHGDIDTPIMEDDTIYLTHLRAERRTITEDVAYEFVTTFDEYAYFGEYEVLVEGTKGVHTLDKVVFFSNGVEINRQILNRTVVTQPIDQTIRVGVKNKVSTSEGDFKYARVLTVEATAYSSEQPNLSNYTFTGERVRHGIVAVDPRYIPLGTIMYIPGYGMALAADTGGAIRGYKLDLAFETIAEAIQFGRRNITVYILE